VHALEHQPPGLAAHGEDALVAQHVVAVLQQQLLDEAAHQAHVHLARVVQHQRGDVVVVADEAAEIAAAPGEAAGAPWSGSRALLDHIREHEGVQRKQRGELGRSLGTRATARAG
jgi:hypothetical protein